MLDGAVKDKACAHFDEAFQIELFFERLEDAAAPLVHKGARQLDFERDGGPDDPDEG